MCDKGLCEEKVSVHLTIDKIHVCMLCVFLCACVCLCIVGCMYKCICLQSMCVGGSHYQKMSLGTFRKVFAYRVYLPTLYVHELRRSHHRYPIPVEIEEK